MFIFLLFHQATSLRIDETATKIIKKLSHEFTLTSNQQVTDINVGLQNTGMEMQTVTSSGILHFDLEFLNSAEALGVGKDEELGNNLFWDLHVQIGSALVYNQFEGGKGHDDSEDLDHRILALDSLAKHFNYRMIFLLDMSNSVQYEKKGIALPKDLSTNLVIVKPPGNYIDKVTWILHYA